MNNAGPEIWTEINYSAGGDVFEVFVRSSVGGPAVAFATQAFAGPYLHALDAEHLADMKAKGAFQGTVTDPEEALDEEVIEVVELLDLTILEVHLGDTTKRYIGIGKKGDPVTDIHDTVEAVVAILPGKPYSTR